MNDISVPDPLPPTGAHAAPSVAAAATLTALTEAAWARRLVEINPWVAEFDAAIDLEENEDFEKARQAACIARWQDGRETWNAWAAAMKALQAEAEAAGLWMAEKDWVGSLKGQNAATSAHLAIGVADFAGVDFVALCEPDAQGVRWAEFDKFVFPYRSAFDGAEFGTVGTVVDKKPENTVNARFGGAQFGGDAGFGGAQFGGDARFGGAQFGGAARFGGIYAGKRTRFAKSTYFTRVQITFLDNYFFRNLPEPLKSRRMAELTAAPWVKFERLADFTDVEFEDTVSFDEARFGDAATFSFIAPKKSLSFADARFRRPPDFIGVKFTEPPRLDNMVIDDPLDWDHYRRFSRLIGNRKPPLPNPLFPDRQDGREPDPRQRGKSRILRRLLFSRMRVARDENEHARFRKLREMAAAAKDYEQETRANAHEIAARRFWAVSPFEPGEKAPFWLGWLYQVFSNYGQSIWRPVMAWFAQIAVFAGLFFWIAVTNDANDAKGRELTACHSTYEVALGQKHANLQATNKLKEAIALSFRDALIFDRSDVTRRMYGCLFGIQEKKETFDYAITPYGVTAFSSLQSLISGLLLFLFGLAVRNQFRMR